MSFWQQLISIILYIYLDFRGTMSKFHGKWKLEESGCIFCTANFAFTHPKLFSVSNVITETFCCIS